MTANFPIQSQFDCPFLTIDLAVPFLRRCFNNTYVAHCCNNGNVTAEDAYVEIILPPQLLLQSASAPYTQNGPVLTFQLGDVPPLQCTDIQLVVKPDCDSTELGQTLCVSARIFPDTLCGYDGALIEASAACDGDSVRFQLHNTGNAPSGALDFIVIDDHVMTYESQFELAANASQEVFAAPADGSTWRLRADQAAGAPGANAPSVAVEGCATGPFSTGFVLQWPNESGSPFFDRDCQELVGAYDPNDKQAQPRGYGADDHFLYANTPLDYRIRFQNTGTDTAFTVVIRDTLSPGLDPGTVRPGAASHAYTWALSGPGILTFTFENILLPDSNVNEPASHGFVEFAIQQQPDLPDGTLLENRAGIYFDFNAPIITNTVWHTIGSDFLPSGIVAAPETASAALGIWPNPATGSVWLELGELPWRRSRITVRNALGQDVRRLYPAAGRVEVARGGLPGGVYTVWWEGGGGRRVGKVVWR